MKYQIKIKTKTGRTRKTVEADNPFEALKKVLSLVKTAGTAIVKPLE